MTVDGSARVSGTKKVAYAVSAVGVAVGVILILVARSLEDSTKYWAEVTRDFGVTFCLLGFVSIVYELVIREQLIDEIARRLTVIVDTDAKRLGILSIFGDRDDRKFTVAQLLKGAKKDIALYGLALYNFAFENRAVLKSLALSTQRRIRILIVDSESPVASAIESSLGSGELVGVIRRATNAFRTLQAELRALGIGPDLFEVRAHEIVPTFGMVALDSAFAGGRIFVEWNGFGIEGQQCPGFELEHSASAPFLFFTQQFEQVWVRAKPLEPKA